MKRLLVLPLLLLFTGCNEIRKMIGTNDTIVNNTTTPGTGLLQIKTFETHDGLTIYSDNRDYHETPTRISFTPLSSNSRIVVRVSGTAMVRAPMPESPADITLYRNGNDLLSNNTTTRPYRLLSGALDFGFDPTYGIVDVQAPVSMEYSELSPGAGHTVIYAVRIRTGDAPPLSNPPPRYEVRWCYTGGTGLYSVITVEEWQQDTDE